MIPPTVVHCTVGGLLVVFSLPLVLRRVPMNHAYGIRLRKSFTSDANWYELNAYGGKLLLAYGVALCAFGVVAGRSAPPPTSAWTPVFVVAPLALVLPVVAAITLRARRLP